LHFRRDDRKSPASLAGARGLDRRVESEQVGLAGDRANESYDLIDALRSVRQRSYRVVGVAGHRSSAPDDLARIAKLRLDGLNLFAKLACGGCHRLDVVRGLVGG